MSPPPGPIDNNTTLIKLLADNYLGHKRGPYGKTDALKRAKQANTNSIERIIVDRSELAWCAYFAGVKAATKDSHFKGQAELTHLLTALATQPTERQQAFAEQLAAHMAESEVDNGSGRAAKRHCATRVDPAAASLTATATPNGTSMCYTGPERFASEQIPSTVVRSDDVHVGASLDGSTNLFPVQFMDSIQRIPSKQQPDKLVADISMFLQKGHIRDHFGCQMEIGIAPEKVSGYAKKLFDVEVEAKCGVRYVRYPSGAKIEPDPSITLRACRRNMILEEFGSEIHVGLSFSPIYQVEEKEMRAYTDGVSMAISNREEDGAKITMYLGEWHASRLKERLYINA